MQVPATEIQSWPESQPVCESTIAAPEAVSALREEVKALGSNQVLYTSGDYQVAVARREQIPRLMNEIGRLREISFRAVGEGTGKDRDIDEFDDYYQQLFVWHAASGQVLGAYRLCMTDVVLRQHGLGGLYTKTLFRYEREFLEALGPAVELGRSFVRVEFQGAGRVLALLWRGIGHLLAKRPRYRTLFGPVSVSSTYTHEARGLIATSLGRGRYRHALANQVEPIRPLAAGIPPHIGLDQEARQLSKRVSELEPDGKGLPVLVREYIKLGGQFLAFSVDPAFHDAMDGLVAVDLDRTSPKLLSLYMGPENHERFRNAGRAQRPAEPPAHEDAQLPRWSP